jgi:hypothetical protein
MARKLLDFYPTPDFFTLCLKHYISKEPEIQDYLQRSVVIEPFVGSGDIVKHFKDLNWVTNDIENYPKHFIQDTQLDLSNIENFKLLPEAVSVITNPPYNLVSNLELLKTIVNKYPLVIMLMRQTWQNPGSGREGTNGRKLILDKIKATITVPRYPMACNKTTGEPQCDASNHCWVVWTDLPVKNPISFYDSTTISGWESW